MYDTYSREIIAVKLGFNAACVGFDYHGSVEGAPFVPAYFSSNSASVSDFSELVLRDSIYSSEYFSREETTDFLTGSKFVANNTFFAGTPPYDFSLILTSSGQIIVDDQMYIKETSGILGFTSERTNIFQYNLSCGKIVRRISDYSSFNGTSYVDNPCDLYPVLQAKALAFPLVIYAAYHEAFNSFLQKLPCVIFLLDENQKSKLKKLGKIGFKEYFLNCLLKFFEKIRFYYN